MHRNRTVVRMLFAYVFCAGGIMHLVAGTVAPKGYAAFGAPRCGRGSQICGIPSSCLVPGVGPAAGGA